MIRIALEKGSNRFEWIHRRMDGTDFPVEVMLTSISTGDRQVIHTVWRDITERKQIEQALHAAHDELEIQGSGTYCRAVPGKCIAPGADG